jgi:hypothetical protein
MEAIYLGYFVRWFPLVHYYHADVDMGGITGHSHLGFFAFVGSFTALFALTALAWWLVHDLDDRATLWLVLGTGAIFGLTMVFVYPITAIDVFTYVAQSRILVHYHANPIAVPPTTFHSDPIMSLTGGWGNVGAPYGPVGILIDAAPSVVLGGSLLANLIGLKVLFTAMALASGFVAYRIVRRVAPASALGGALLVAWNPVVLFETSANGHNDVAMVLLAMLALLAAVDGELLAALVLLAASALVKYATVLLLPLLLVYCLSRQPTWERRAIFLAKAALAVLIVVVIAYKPFWYGPDTLSRSLVENQHYVQSFPSVAYAILPLNLTLDQATLLGRLLFLWVYGYALWLSARGLPGLLRACFLTLLSILALAVNNFRPWYAVWPAIVGAAVPGLPDRAAALALGFGSAVSATAFGYVLWWYPSNDPAAASFLNNVAYSAAFLPSVVVLGIFLSVEEPEPPARDADAQAQLPDVASRAR